MPGARALMARDRSASGSSAPPAMSAASSSGCSSAIRSSRIVGLSGRDPEHEPHRRDPSPSRLDRPAFDAAPPDADAVFLALPHGAAAAHRPAPRADGTTLIDLGPDFRLRDPADYPRWYGFDHPAPELLASAVYGLPELHRAELEALRGRRAPSSARPAATRPPRSSRSRRSPGPASSATSSSTPRAASRAPAASPSRTSISPRSTRASRPTASAATATSPRSSRSSRARRRAGRRNPGAARRRLPAAPDPDDAGHPLGVPRPPDAAVTQAELDALYGEAYARRAVRDGRRAPPATKHVPGSNHAGSTSRLDERTGRVLAIGVLDNLVKGAAGQAIQAFNLVLGLPETPGLEQLPLAP